MSKKNQPIFTHIPSRDAEKRYLILHNANKDTLPKWCFLTDKMLGDNIGELPNYDQRLMSEYIDSALTSVWNITKKTYTIEDDTFDEINNADFPHDIQAEDFYGLPYWCTKVVYKQKYSMLLMFTLFQDAPTLYLSQSNADEYEERMEYNAAAKMSLPKRYPLFRASFTKVTDSAFKDLYTQYQLIGTGQLSANDEEAIQEGILALKICLYLSAQRPDEDKNAVYIKRDYEQYKKGDNIIVADQETVIPLENIIVEKDISEVDITEFEEVVDGLHGHHKSPCTHYRRGHWKNQPCGKGRKDRKLVWIPPTIVNAHKK